ncbi:hypothetical protein HYC85_005292 [Camellia sinensis]|uniref:serine O-acetyltransferase n=1 Tax=Camellia sinensis TaxID=4442 RepID=A0A7J7I094_CAMSI|nr:hypothetical protein HYC85_005292 [Camellia sinensis]
MACLSDDSCFALSDMLSTHTLLSKSKEEDEESSNNTLDSKFMELRLEKVFPVYAMGFSKPDPPPMSPFSIRTLPPMIPFGTLSDKRPSWSILAHDCLEQALGFVIANRLQSPTLLATQLMDIFCKIMMDDRAIQRSIRLNVQAFKDRDPSCLSYCSALLYLKGYHSLQTYRVAHALWNQGRKVLALALQSRISEVFGVDIHPAAKIGEGILLDHGTGVVIGETAVIGNRVSLMQGVTLGGTGKEIGDRHPKVRQGALIGASATILGNIEIGEGAMIAAGSLVLKNVTPHSMVAGIPAKVIGYVDEQDPSLTMKHDANKEFFEHVAVSCMEGRSSDFRVQWVPSSSRCEAFDLLGVEYLLHINDILQLKVH